MLLVEVTGSSRTPSFRFVVDLSSTVVRSSRGLVGDLFAVYTASRIIVYTSNSQQSAAADEHRRAPADDVIQ